MTTKRQKTKTDDPDEFKNKNVSLRAEDELKYKDSLGLRTLFNFIAFILLGLGIQIGNGFFISLFMFSFALCFDIMRFYPHDSLRRILRLISRCCSWVLFAVSGLGIAGILNICYDSRNELSIFLSNKFILQFHNGLNMKIAYLLLFSQSVLFLL